MGWMSAAAAAVRDAVMPPRLVLDLEPTHTFDTAPRPVDLVISEMFSGSNSRVSRADALTVAAVQRGRNEICSLGTLPLRLYRGSEILPNALFRQFDLDVPNVVHMSQTIEDLLFEGIAWWRVVGQDFDGYPVAVRRVDPGKVSLTQPTGKGDTVPAGYDKTGSHVWIGSEKLPASLMIRFDSPNPGLLRACARSIRRAILLDQLSAVYAANPRPLDYFTDNLDAADDFYDDDEVRSFLAEWAAARRASSTGWLPRQVTRVDVNAPSPAELQLLERQRQVTLEIANGIGVDPEDLGVSTTSRTYQNEDARRRDKINRMFGPYMVAITDRLGMGDVTRYGHTVRFDLSDYLKSDPAARLAYYQGMKELIGLTPEWIAAAEGFPASALGPIPAPSTPAALPAGGQENSARPPIRLGDITPRRAFDADGPVRRFSAYDFDGTPGATVDTAARTITGLAVPYGKTSTKKMGRRYRFTAGSLEYSTPDRMAHLIDHSTPVGFHRSIKDTAAGPLVELAVLDGPEGSPAKAQRDQLLYDAEHGLYSGLSIGVDFSDFEEDGDVVYHADDDVWDVVRATWRETSTTYMPSFDDARVTRVAASLTGGLQMEPCQHCGHRHATGVSCATFAAQMRQQPQPPTPGPQPQPHPGSPAPNPTGPPSPEQQYAAFMAWQQQQNHGAPSYGQLVPAGAQNGQGYQNGQGQQFGPAPVSPHREIAQVREPSPYRFDRRGNLRRGSHDFSTDLLTGFRPGSGDQGARDRAQTFVTEYFEAQNEGQADREFAVTPANVTALNYPANRPDMYVDQLDYQYPLYNAVNKGTLSDITPFVIPKFATATGLVAPHVTGTEPTPGAFTATAQTITPVPVSGKVEITREAVDQGGNPQMSGLIWRQMVRGWYEALEAFAQAQILALAGSITDILITTAAADAVLDQALADAFVPLQYIRGGDVFDTVFTQIDLYKAMVKAKDSSGRRLYPQLGAMNAVGTTTRGYSQIDAHGKLFIPAWALPASSVNTASSWMFDSEVVCLWASAPRQINLEWRVAWVDMGIWGYEAFGITDFTRIRELTYDPV